MKSKRVQAVAALFLAANAAAGSVAFALDGDPLKLRLTTLNGWKAFELISVNDNPAGDGITYALPGTFDGIGVWSPTASTLRILVNHETADASVSEINLNYTNFKTAITNVINTGSTGGGSFVTSAQQAYGRWSSNGGSTWTTTTSNSTTTFNRFCSSQLHEANTFGVGRGFVDKIYITGEEGGTNRLFANDVANRDFYQLSGVTGNASALNGGTGGMPFDSWENAALIDTGNTTHVAMLLSPDGNTNTLQLYIGVKGKDAAGNNSSSFLARNGLAYGSSYYLRGSLPSSGTLTGGTFGTTLTTGTLTSAKLEDVDTNPNNPTQVAIGVQETGLFTLNFNLSFSGGNFNAAGSGFSVTKVLNHTNDTDGQFGDADNVDWTKTTTLNGTTYANGLIFVNEDSGTNNGEIWMVAPDGSGLTLVANTSAFANATETSGILDISTVMGYMPGSILLVANQGTDSSMSVLINPNATLVPEPGSMSLLVLGATALHRRRRR